MYTDHLSDAHVYVHIYILRLSLGNIFFYICICIYTDVVHERYAFVYTFKKYIRKKHMHLYITLFKKGFFLATVETE